MTVNTWYDPKKWVTGEALNADDLEREISANLTFLRHLPRAISGSLSVGINTNSTVFVAVDPIFKIDIAIPDGDLLVGFTAGGVSSSAAAAEIQFDILMSDGQDSVYLSSMTSTPATNGLYRQTGGIAAARHQINLHVLLTGLPAGTYTFELYWRASSTSTLNMAAPNSIQQLWARLL